MVKRSKMKVLLCLNLFVAMAASASIEHQLQLLQKEIRLIKDEMKVNKNAMNEEINELKVSNEKVQQQLELRQLEPSLVSASEVSVAFSTRLHEPTQLSDSPVVFGTVNLNIGDGYDEFTGVFNPPVDGVYLLTVYGVRDGVGGPMYIKNNEEVLCQAFLTGTDHADTATCTAIAELAAGDSVRVTGSSSEPAALQASRSGFIGHILEGAPSL